MKKFINLYNKLPDGNEKKGMDKFIEMMLTLRQQIFLKHKFENELRKLK